MAKKKKEFPIQELEYPLPFVPNETCITCKKLCKQSSQVIIVKCPHFSAKE